VNDVFQQPFALSLEGGALPSLRIPTKVPVFSDPLSLSLLEFIKCIAPSDTPVLVSGESGTGKELIARQLHLFSGRRGNFVVLNCGNLDEHQVDLELFGEANDSSLYSNETKKDWFEKAEGGTLFLNEICDLPLSAQANILQVLNEKTIRRAGIVKPIPIDVRLIASSSIDVNSAVAAGNFNRELLYRINIAHVKLRALRYRVGDIVPLAEYFLKFYNQRMGCRPPVFSSDAIDLLLDYSWPGNVRELENAIHFALLVAGTTLIEPRHIRVTGGWSANRVKPAEKHAYQDKNKPGELFISRLNNDPILVIASQLQRLFNERGQGPHSENFEKLIVEQAFLHAKSNQVKASALLGISRNVMRTLLKRYSLVANNTDVKAESYRKSF